MTVILARTCLTFRSFTGGCVDFIGVPVSAPVKMTLSYYPLPSMAPRRLCWGIRKVGAGGTGDQSKKLCPVELSAVMEMFYISLPLGLWWPLITVAIEHLKCG